jgi:transposase
MSTEDIALPNDVNELKELFVETLQHYETEIKLLKEEINILRHRLFGRKSEKLSVGNGQLFLFNEAEQIEAVAELTEPKEDIEVPAHRRRKPGRKPLPADLPRIDKIHDISEEEKICACGTQKSQIGEEVSEQLDIIPPKIQVI